MSCIKYKTGETWFWSNENNDLLVFTAQQNINIITFTISESQGGFKLLKHTEYLSYMDESLCKLMTAKTEGVNSHFSQYKTE